MSSLMEVFLSTVLGELASRSINFIISKSTKPKMRDVESKLQRALLRAQVIIDEATGRHITNQGMLQQLDMMRDAMYQSCHILDTFRYQSHGEEDARDQVVSHSLSVSKASFLREICFSNTKTQILEQLQDSLDNLSSMILDVKELIVFLTSYPRLYCVPYSMHLQLSNCMFGHQMETELVLSFLLHTQPHGSEELEVLPIVGPAQVGKSTLLAHVCKNERVLDHFSEIVFFRDHDFRYDDISTLREGCVMKHQNCISNSYKKGRLLVVVDLVGDLSDDAWNMLYSSYKQRMPSSTKILVASRSDNIVKFGTTQALSLKYPSREAFWYFFKTVTFGSMDPEMHPRFAHLAMEIAKMLSGSLLGANVLACFLRENFDIHFWCKVRAFLRGFTQKHITKFNCHPFDLVKQNRPVHLGRMATPYEDLVQYCVYESSSEELIPEIRFQDVMYGSVKVLGKFEVLGWISPIPPYYTYVATCEVRQLRSNAAKRKRFIENEIDLC